MQEIKQNFLTDEWVFFSTERNNRPNNYADSKSLINSKLNCPFCPENKHMTEYTIFESENKRVRIIPNKYPAISSLDDLGAHDVVIDTPIHEEKLAFFSINDIYTIFDAIKQRIKDLKKLNHIKYVQVFKNDGSRAGASIYHSHFQIIAMPIIPSKQHTISNNFLKYYKENNCCYLCNVLKSLNNEIILENEDFIAFASETSMYANGIDIAPKFHESDFCEFTETQLMALSSIVKPILLVYHKIYKDFNYNISFQIAPFGEKYKYSHFYLQIIPRSSGMAGFEFSSGSFINSVLPSTCAENFRRLLNEN